MMLSKTAVLAAHRTAPEEPVKITFEVLDADLRRFVDPVVLHLPSGEQLIIEQASLDYVAAYARLKRTNLQRNAEFDAVAP